MAGALRITGGALARRRIEVPPAADKGLVRPTSDKIREALMNSLGDALEGAVVVDLFAGSGALGIEALSRGAARAVFVERDRRTASVVKANLEALGLSARAELLVEDAARYLSRAPNASCDVVFVDPPYALALDAALLARLVALVRPGGLVVIERDRRTIDPAAEGLSLMRERVYGDTRVATWERRREGSPMPTAAIYAGSFDPLTNGHVDIVHRGLKTFDRVVLAIANNPQKSHIFSADERLAMARGCLGHLAGIEFDTFDGLLVEYAQGKGVKVLLRGLRAVSDFEYEFQLASMNRKLARDIETVFMMTSEESFYLSSRLVREVASFGADVREMVPAPVFEALKHRYNTAPRKPLT